ncbi:TCR/Tet family MFS transporter [Citrobacter sp. Cf134]|uniref:TCR/Tet family MFS transporter n=1 Tax=Citrobacter sp. Cf134 TaxID=2985079 RepID=UPI0025784E57|nr:TCR/Tet family MFS transporter [Citrobacter sp. Cf134]MDM3101554.1 TCR/Tet family MFS transporter [Citrobacter sp. Cf134]
MSNSEPHLSVSTRPASSHQDRLTTQSNKPRLIILSTIGLDALGIGLVFPILPRLLQEVTGTTDIAPYIGVMAALYALMQFVCAPVLGALSDRRGRRPILLFSLAGATMNYAIMAFAPTLGLLLLGRAIAGVSSANIAVAAAYMTDVSQERDRARNFGLMSAVFGAGFIAGPVLGGVLGEIWTRLPFVAAAVLNLANYLFTLFMLPESRKGTSGGFDFRSLNPVTPFQLLIKTKKLWPVVGTYFLLSASGEAYGCCWALWGFDAFNWNGTWIGLSLGMFGICQMLVQIFLPGPAVRKLGERRTVFLGIAASCIALIVMAFAEQGWVVFAVMPLFALAGLGTPAFQAVATRQVDDASQGQLQGMLSSATSLASVFAPLGFSGLYFITRETLPGAVWLTVLALYILAVPLIYISMRTPPKSHNTGLSL